MSNFQEYLFKISHGIERSTQEDKKEDWSIQNQIFISIFQIDELYKKPIIKKPAKSFSFVAEGPRGSEDKALASTVKSISYNYLQFAKSRLSYNYFFPRIFFFSITYLAQAEHLSSAP